MSELRTTVRVTAEGLGVISRAVLTFLVLVYDTRSGGQGSLALLAFATGQLAYGVVVLLAYMAHYNLGAVLPKGPHKEYVGISSLILWHFFFLI